MNRWTKLIIASVAAVALLSVGTMVLAQTPTPPASPPSAKSTDQPSPGDVFWNTLAAKLGKDVESVKAAFRDAAKAVVAQRVKEGTLRVKQDQADKLNERIDKMPLNQVPIPILPPKQSGSQDKAQFESLKQMLDTAANVLNMSPRDLMQELRDGLTLGQIAQQKGVDPNKLKAAMLAVPYSRIDEAVKNGKMTLDKATELKTKLEKGLDFDKRIQLPNTPPVKPQKPSRPSKP